MQVQDILIVISAMLAASSIRLLRALSPNSFPSKTFHFSTLTKGRGRLSLECKLRNPRIVRFSSGTDVNVNEVAAKFSAGTATGTNGKIIGPRRVKIIDVKQPCDELIFIKGWVKTVRKQKTLAFVEVNDGSTLSGIQCVLTFDGLDESIKNGKIKHEICY
jgi:asparaginyl-tRNA synthetase